MRDQETTPPASMAGQQPARQSLIGRLRRWWWARNHVCSTPDPRTFAPIEGREWVCPECAARWVYEARDIEYEVQPAVWDRWAETATETVVAWYRKGAHDDR